MADSLSPLSRPSGTRRALIALLKRNGASDAGALGRQLEVSAMAVRQHLYALRDAGFVAARETARPRGRPAKLWHLTPGAEVFFPDGHADLVTDLLGAMRQAFGDAQLDRLIQVRAQAQRRTYGTRLGGTADLADRLAALAAVRSEEGYMADVQREEDGGFLLVENHCPICAAATTCQGLCRSELEVFRSVLGAGIAIERVEHIPEGARRCAYRVRPL